jgi:hypothetical protein
MILYARPLCPNCHSIVMIALSVRVMRKKLLRNFLLYEKEAIRIHPGGR